MPKKRTKASRSKASGASRAQQALREAWANTLHGLTRAEAEIEKQVRALLKKNKLNVDDAAEMLLKLRSSVEQERKRGMSELEARLKLLQARVRKEGGNVAKLANEAVQSALAALNIPSRREVAELTRKVEELSRRLGALRRSSR